LKYRDIFLKDAHFCDMLLPEQRLVVLITPNHTFCHLIISYFSKKPKNQKSSKESLLIVEINAI
jgi:hypothetical protein